MTGNQNQRGISIVELMVVICIMTVLMGFASMGTDLVRDARLRRVTQELLSDIQQARVRAMTREARGYGIRFQSSRSYVVFRFEDCNDDNTYDAGACGGNSREEADVSIKTISPEVVLKRQGVTDDFNNNILIFDRDGISRSATWAFGNMTIVVKNDADQAGIKCITVSATRVREGVWGWDRREHRDTCLE